LWGKLVSLNTDVKHHYFIGNDAACGEVKLDDTSYIRYSAEPPSKENACSKCQKILGAPVPIY